MKQLAVIVEIWDRSLQPKLITTFTHEIGPQATNVEASENGYRIHTRVEWIDQDDNC